MTLTQTYTVYPISPDALEQLRVVDDVGRRPTTVVDDAGGSPLRCCLRASRPGEDMLLVSYAPLRRWAAARGADPAAYDEVGPVFIHRDDCGGAAHDGWPDDFLAQPRVLRAYDDNGRIIGGVLLGEEDDKERALAELCSDPAVALVTARAVVYGCFTFAVQPR